MRLTDGLAVSFDGYYALTPLRTAIGDRLKMLGAGKAAAGAAAALKAFDRKVDAVQNGTSSTPGVGAVNREMARLFSMVESGDGAPTAPLRSAVAEWCGALGKAVNTWSGLATEVAGINKQLAGRKLPPLDVPQAPGAPACVP